MAQRCIPTPDGGQVCTTGPELFCGNPHTEVVCDPLHGDACRCEPVKPVCEVRILYKGNYPQEAQLVQQQNWQCDPYAAQMAVAMILAKMLAGLR